MGYPENVDQFPIKLNKKTDGGVYVIEEELPITDGKYEGLLAHDNINNNSIRVYTGPKLTGDEIVNYIISIPSDASWRRHIKVFADVSKVYVTYETQGDIVEADDVNVLQDAMTATQGEVDRYKAANDAVVSGIDARLKTAEANKAEQTYVDTQLLLKADKANTYTKTETDARIQDVIAAAPEALDTLQEIAEALNNDPDFAGTMTTQLAGKVDKVTGKGLSTEDYTTAEKTKLSGIASGAGTAGSAADTVIGSRTISDTEAPSSNTGTLTTLLGWLANMVKSITGKSTWRTAPAITLEATKTHVDDTVSHITAAERTAWGAKSSLSLGETADTAYRGDRGKIAYDHSQSTHAPSNANYYAHPESGVSAGTYHSVTVNAQGHVTNGTNPTTIAGYGITDAYTKAEVDSKASPHGKQLFTSSGTFTVPDGVTEVWVTLKGAGGGGLWNNYLDSGARKTVNLSGGHGGTTTIPQRISVTPRETITITIGTGGITGYDKFTYNSNTTNWDYSMVLTPTAGGSSSFGSYLSAVGGGSASAKSSHNDVGYNGTSGSCGGNWAPYGMGGSASSETSLVNGADGFALVEW